MRRTMKLIGLFSCMHALLAITFLLMAFGTSMRRFDTGQVETAGERAISRTADVLFLPASLLWTRWASETFPDVVEWVLFTANSVLWGSVLALVVTRIWRPLRAQ